MILIEPKVEIIPQSEGLEGIYKQIELAGRTCYKSEDKITADSAKDFVQRMINNGHTAMLEHGTIYLICKATDCGGDMRNLPLFHYINNKYSNVIDNGNYLYITTNLRVLVENDWMDDLKYYLCEPTQWHVRRVCVRFICDRGVSHELVRHRVFSFAQESTRYCNYSRDKFGGQITCIKPSWYNNASMPIKNFFEGSLQCAEDSYFTLLENNYTPQQARQVLPNALKTEIVMTGFIDDWKHFFELRCAKNAHPDMQVVANLTKDLFIKNKYI